MMSAEMIYYTIIVFILLGYFLDRVLSWLNVKNWKEEIPDEMKDFYDADKYKKARNYELSSNKFALISSTFSLILILAVLFIDGFAIADSIVRSITEHTYYLPLLYFGLLFIISDLISLPFSIYSTFLIEEKYGFNKTTALTFLTDKLKSYLIAIILGGALLSAFIWFYTIAGEYFWLAAWIFFSAVSIFMVMFYSSLIVPLFNKLKPLAEGNLRSDIETYCEKVGFKLSNLFVIDGSKRSTKSNAYFSGLGPKKKIVLYDTLIEKQEDGEIVAVLAHEIGHYKLKHTFWSVVISILNTGIMLYILGLVVGSSLLGEALGVENMSLHIGLIAFSLLYSPVSTITGIVMNMLSRKNEFEADAYAAKTFSGEKLAIALKKLSVDNLGNLYPHPAYVFVHHSHPPVLKRIEAIKKINT